MYKLIEVHQETQVQRLQHPLQIILLVLVEQLHLLQVKTQLQRLIPLLLGLLVEPRHLTPQPLSQQRGKQVKLLLNQRQDRLQLLVLRQLLGILVELQLLIQVLQHLKILLLRLIQVHPQQRHSNL